ncbi:NrfD/PsrC family molybdoenzyme membrane anchor subunit [Dictyobacter halimunensis]
MDKYNEAQSQDIRNGAGTVVGYKVPDLSDEPKTSTPLVDSRIEWKGPADTYYNIPLLKKAHWTWEIMLYFFLGGLSGGAFLVSSIAHFFGAERDAPLVRAGRYLSFVAILISPVLLIKDLGRPERFLHMLRVFKLRSVMSLGTWGITTFGLCNGLVTVHQAASDGLLNWCKPLAWLANKLIPVKLLEVVGSILGLFVGSYTGVLLSSTAVPIWARARRVLGPLFVTSGLSTALAALSLILSFGRPKHDTVERLERAELITTASELGLIASLVPMLGSLGKPLFKGKSSLLFTVGSVGAGMALPLSLNIGKRLARKTDSRSLTIASSLLVLIGGFILRMEWVRAGRKSADSTADTHEYNTTEWHEGHK